LFFNSNKTIKECQEKLAKYKIKEEVARSINAPIMLKQSEIDEIIRCNKIAGSAVHPDTGEIIPFYMRMSGFVMFNVPLVFAVLFTPN